MRDLGKVNTSMVFGLWRNLTVCLVAVMVTILISKILPYYLSPIVALVVATGLYVYIYNVRASGDKSCMVPTITILYSIVGYAFLTIILNMFHIWGLFEMPKEFVFFTNPFIPALILNPVSFIIITGIYLYHNKLKLCINCKLQRSFGGQRGAVGVLNREAHIQMRNFIIFSGLLSLAVWAYYQFYYIDVNVNGRDTYIFTWLTIIAVFLDELYFSIRYYNLYLDFLESNELITPAELRDMTAKTYLRFYVICGDNIYLNQHANEYGFSNNEVFDTPFFTKQTMNGILAEDVKKVIEKMTGVKNGELRFFYGRKSPDDDKHSLLRYFYFLDGDISDYPELEAKGEWVSFDKVKYLYSNNPGKMAELAVYDITRLATIMLTEKIFNEEGYRKTGLKSYNPSFNLIEVKKSKLDFQDDKWIEISMFNSDTPLYGLKKWWRRLTGNKKKKIQ
ncbi:MAG: hypothetical protein J1E95_06065 [Muribaculaceae bacterium]|nr:hypothetical protein [Muribaculaceae bacterium]